jgi:FkbM family methyltransferase
VRIGKNDYDGLIISSEYGQSVEFNSNTLEPFKNRKGKIIDVGANIGVMSIILSQEFDYSEIICFEPGKNSCEIADKNLEICGINHKAYNLAISNVNGKVGFDESRNSQNSKLNLDEKENTVETRTLDSYDFNDVILIKIDVEGHEVEVMEGAIDTINRNKPIVLLEYHEEASASRIFEIIKDLNYNWISLETDGLFDEGRINQLLLTLNELEDDQ